MREDEFLSLAYEWNGAEDWAGEAAGDDHRRLDTPAETVLLHREFDTYAECMWIHGYPGAKMIAITCPATAITSGAHTGAELPGVVRSIPVGWRDMASAETFRSRFFATVASYEHEGWRRKDHSVRVDGAAGGAAS